MMKSRDSSYRISVTPEEVTAMKEVVRQYRESNVKITQEARKAIQETGGEMPILLMTLEEYFNEMKSKAVANGPVMVRPEDL